MEYENEAEEGIDHELHEVWQEAIAEFDRVQEAQQGEREQCVEDRRFATISGAMWEDKLGEQFTNLPKPEVNKIRLSINRILNEYRQNRVTVNFLPSDGTEDDITETLNGLFRADENDSNAQLAYLNAFDEKLNGGIGAWRLSTCYEDEGDPDNEKQRIIIEPIVDADTSVYFDLDSKRQDKSDATKCWVVKSVTPEYIEEEYGVTVSSINKVINDTYFDWFTPDFIYIAEYYKVEEFKKRLIKFTSTINQDVITEDKAELSDERLNELTALGYVETSRRTVKDRKVHKYIICGSQVLEDCGYIAGKYIPIVIDFGQRWFVDNIERYMGHVRLAKDVTRLGNMVLSKLAQIASQSATSVPIITPAMVAGGLATMWENANINNPPYMLVNPLMDANGNEQIPVINYTQTPQIPPAVVALYEMVEKHLMDVLGNQQEGEKLRANTSEAAIELVQNKIDQQSYVYFDNHCIAMKRCGEIWLSMAKDVYVEEGRKMKAIDETGERMSIELMKPTIIEGELRKENDLTSANMEVVVDVGEAYASRREKTVSNLIKLYPMVAQSDPVQGALIASTIMINMDGEGVGNLRDYNRKKLVMSGIVEPTEDEIAEMQQAQQNQQPDAQQAYLLAASQEAQAKAQLAQVNAQKALAEAKKTEVQTAEIIANMQSKDQKDTLEALAQLNNLQATNQPNQ
jgi:hypothetical protein